MQNNCVSQEKIKNTTKVIIRYLPPLISEDVLIKSFLNQYSKTWNWFRFNQGRNRNSFGKHLIHSTAYLNFINQQLAEDFIQNTSGHIFLDEKGESFKIVTHYAPYQKVPRNVNIHDRRINTMESDPIYINFIESKNSDITTTNMSKPLSNIILDPKQIVSPLVLALEKKRKSYSKRESEVVSKQKDPFSLKGPKKKVIILSGKNKKLTSTPAVDIVVNSKEYLHNTKNTSTSKAYSFKKSDKRKDRHLREKKNHTTAKTVVNTSAAKTTQSKPKIHILTRDSSLKNNDQNGQESKLSPSSNRVVPLDKPNETYLNIPLHNVKKFGSNRHPTNKGKTIHKFHIM